MKLGFLCTWARFNTLEHDRGIILDEFHDLYVFLLLGIIFYQTVFRKVLIYNLVRILECLAALELN